MDRGAWPATVHGVTKSWTGLSKLSTHGKLKRSVRYSQSISLLDFGYSKQSRGIVD